MQNHKVDGVWEREARTSPLERWDPFILKKASLWSVQCSQVDGVGPPAHACLRITFLGYIAAESQHIFLSQICLWQAPAKRMHVTQQTQSDSKCVIKCFAESRPGSFLLNIHMLFAVAIRSRCRHCEPMFITLMLLTSPWLRPPEDWSQGTMEKVSTSTPQETVYLSKVAVCIPYVKNGLYSDHLLRCLNGWRCPRWYFIMW